MPWEEYLERWSPQSRSMVIAVMLEKAERCTLCGTSPREWEDDAHAYVAMQDVCPGCATKDRFHEGLSPDTKTPGSSVRLVPADKAARMAAKPAARPMSPRERKKQQR